MKQTSRPSVFFDGGCPLCRREIDFYRRRKGAERIDWVDLTKGDGHSLPHGLCYETAMARFHISRADGQLVAGGAAFAYLWTQLDGFRAFGRIAETRVGVSILDSLYPVFLKVRPILSKWVSA